MPLIYRPPASPSSSSSSSTTLEPTDADDSIVLSDLVRTGEASRLRRRGAMRIDHAFVNQFISVRPEERDEEREVLDPVYASENLWVERVREEEENEEGELRGWWGATGEYEERAPMDVEEDDEYEEVPDEDDYGYTLFCGGEEDHPDPTVLFRNEVFVPSILPSYPSSSSSSSSPSKRNVNASTSGCGTPLRILASARRRRKDGAWVWVATSSSSGKERETVAVMDASYFDQGLVKRHSCGCVTEGVGCVVCGNPLGTRTKPCQAALYASPSLARPPASASAPVRPDSWEYHHPPTASPSSGRRYRYTFFVNAVSSSPSLSPPRVSPSPPTTLSPAISYRHLTFAPPAINPNVPAGLNLYHDTPTLNPHTPHTPHPHASNLRVLQQMERQQQQRREEGRLAVPLRHPLPRPGPEAETGRGAESGTVVETRVQGMFDRVLTASPAPMDTGMRVADASAAVLSSAAPLPAPQPLSNTDTSVPFDPDGGDDYDYPEGGEGSMDKMSEEVGER